MNINQFNREKLSEKSEIMKKIYIITHMEKGWDLESIFYSPKKALNFVSDLLSKENKDHYKHEINLKVLSIIEDPKIKFLEKALKDLLSQSKHGNMEIFTSTIEKAIIDSKNINKI